MVEALDRVQELGPPWLGQVFKTDFVKKPSKIFGLVINRDFLPSGWVKDERIPIVDSEFMQGFVSSPRFTGLESLYEAARQLDTTLVSEYPLEETSEEIHVGEYIFECPAMERK